VTQARNNDDVMHAVQGFDCMDRTSRNSTYFINKHCQTLPIRGLEGLDMVVLFMEHCSNFDWLSFVMAVLGLYEN